jgi:hypothetical protein
LLFFLFRLLFQAEDTTAGAAFAMA